MTYATPSGPEPALSDGTLLRTIDDHGLAPALFGFIRATGTWRPGSLAGLQRIACYLDGSWQPAQDGGRPAPVGNGEWALFLGRIGAIALRAAAPSTRPERRERLLALLEIWSDAVFADPRVRWRVGTAPHAGDTTSGPLAVRDDRGATIRIGHTANQGIDTVLELRTGDADPPTLGVRLGDVAEAPRDTWGTQTRIRELVTLIRARGPVPWDRRAVRLLAGETGMSHAAAALTLAGVPGSSGYYKPFLDADERRVLHLKVAEADAGRGELAHLTPAERLDLLARALPDEPAALWEPDAPLRLAERVAETWREHHGPRSAIPEPTLALIHALDTNRPAAALCAAFADPAGDALAGQDLDTWLRWGQFGAWVTDGGSEPGRAAVDFTDLLRDTASIAPVVYAELPAGDPVRDGLPGLIAALRARLAHPGLILGERGDPRIATTAELRSRFGPEPYAGPEQLGAPAFDSGPTIAVAPPSSAPTRIPPGARLFLRPSRIPADETAGGTASPPRDLSYPAMSTRAVVDRLRGGYFTRMAERVAHGDLPAGAYEANPAASTPHLVARVATALRLQADAAALYLQLLALETPEDRRVRRWNAWSPARHRAAGEALLAAGLVVRDKRPRAGRDLFLPGSWADAPKHARPMEVWKARLLNVPTYGERTVARRPIPDLLLPELFLRAWTLVENGEGPR